MTDALAAQVARDLERLNLPPRNWPASRRGPDGAPALDVLIVGAGMCGIAAAAGLIFKGVRNIRLVDREPAGREGPWLTTARMETLRSPKHIAGPAMNIPSLTFRAWYEALYGEAGWERLDKIANADWAAYLLWLRRVLALPVENEVELRRLEPRGGLVAATVRRAAGEGVLHARRVVLATGRGGAGGLYVPDFVDRALWPDLAAHAYEAIDFARLAGRRVVVLGGGAAAWDNAATALEQGARRVDMIVRRAQLPQINKGRGSAGPGFFEGFPGLDPAERWKIIAYKEDLQSPPPRESVLRALRLGGIQVRLGTPMIAARRDGDRVLCRLDAPPATLSADFLIVATGFRIDLDRCPEFAGLAPLVATWGDRYDPPAELRRPSLAIFPYLGSGFELQERQPGACPDLARIHLFNYAANTSLGALSGDIPGMTIGAERLARAIARHFFREDLDHVWSELEAFAEAELEGTPFFAR